MLQLNASVSRAFSIGNSLTLTPHLLATGYNESGHYSTFNVNPSLIAEYEGYHLGTLTFETGYKHQYLAQTGMTSTGLPIDPLSSGWHRATISSRRRRCLPHSHMTSSS